MQYHKTLPEDGCWRAVYESEFYRLRYRKKMLYEDNREFKEGLRYLIWSSYGRRWYERRLLTGITTEEDISYYVGRKMLWIYPEEDHREEIREEVEKAKLPYWELMKIRQAEMDFERHSQLRNDGDGFKYKMMVYKRDKQRHKR